jgi:hypothetical protein
MHASALESGHRDRECNGIRVASGRVQATLPARPQYRNVTSAPYMRGSPTRT